jgi:hypothetical protein
MAGRVPIERAGERPANARLGHDLGHTSRVRDHKRITSSQKSIICSYFYAPEWTRTTTPYTQDKALNLARLPIPPQAQSKRV